MGIEEFILEIGITPWQAVSALLTVFVLALLWGLLYLRDWGRQDREDRQLELDQLRQYNEAYVETRRELAQTRMMNDRLSAQLTDALKEVQAAREEMRAQERKNYKEMAAQNHEHEKAVIELRNSMDRKILVLERQLATANERITHLEKQLEKVSSERDLLREELQREQAERRAQETRGDAYYQAFQAILESPLVTGGRKGNNGDGPPEEPEPDGPGPSGGGPGGGGKRGDNPGKQTVTERVVQLDGEEEDDAAETATEQGRKKKAA